MYVIHRLFSSTIITLLLVLAVSCTVTPGDFSVSTQESTVTLRPGETADVHVFLDRHHGFARQVTISLSGAPAGLSAPALVLGPAESAGVLTLTASPTAEQAEVYVSIQAESGGLQASAYVHVSVRGHPGEPDRRFGTNGVQPVAFQMLRRVLPLPDGSLILVGMVDDANPHAGVAKLDASGLPEASFGEAGWLVDPWRIAGMDILMDVTRDGEGRLVAAGYIWQGGNDNSAMLMRFDEHGNLDSQFGIDGKTTFRGPGGGALEIRAVAVAEDGRILVGGYLPAPEPGSALVARLNPDGSLDPTFGTDGFLMAPAEPRHLWGIIERLVAHPDGTFVAVGQLRWDAGSDGLIWRFDADGGAPAFAGEYLTLGASSPCAHLTSLHVDASDRLLLAGEKVMDGEPGLFFKRYLMTGAVDPAFATTGTGSLAADLCETPQVVEDAQGRIVLVHSHLYSTLVRRYTPAGQIDPAFGTGGVATIDESMLQGTEIDDPYCETVAILPDGRVAIGLYDTVASSEHAAVAVLWD